MKRKKINLKEKIIDRKIIKMLESFQPKEMVINIRIDYDIESFLYRTIDICQNDKNSYYRDIRRLGMIWVRMLIIKAYLADKTKVLTQVDSSFNENHVKLLECFGFNCEFGEYGSGIDMNYRTLSIDFYPNI